MVVAELEAFYSRPIAPTRRIAIGELTLADPLGRDARSAGAASMLLGGMAAAFGRQLGEDDGADLRRLLDDVERGRRIPQPRLRHRFQVDRVGLKRSVSRLVRDRAGYFHLDLDHHTGTAAQQALAAVYAAKALPGPDRRVVLAAFRRGLDWNGTLGPELLGMLRGTGPLRGPAASVADPVEWALGILELTSVDGRPARREVQRAFRTALRAAHPDHGAPLDGAAVRIEELDMARKILLG